MRRLVHLEVIAGRPAAEYPPLSVVRGTARSDPASPWNRVATRDGWLWLAERTVGGLAPTLRAAFLTLAGFAGIVLLIGVAFGFGGVLLGGLLGVTLLVVAIRLSRRGRSTVLPPPR